MRGCRWSSATARASSTDRIELISEYVDTPATGSGPVIRRKDGRGLPTVWNYDAAHRLTELHRPGYTGGVAHRTGIEYDAGSRPWRLTDGNGTVVEQAWDLAAREVEREVVTLGTGVSPLATRERISFDELGRISSAHTDQAIPGNPFLLMGGVDIAWDSLGRKTQEAFTYTGVSMAHPVEIDSGYLHTQSPTVGDTGFRRSLAYGASGFEVTSMPDDIGRLEQRDLRLPGASSAFGHASYSWSGGVALTRSLSLNGSGSVDRAVALDGYRRLDTLTHTATGPSTVVDTRNFAWSPAGELLQRGYTKQGTGVGDMFDYDNHHRLIGSKLGVAALGGSYGSTSADRELAYALEPGQSRDSVTETLAGSGSTLTDYTNEAASPRYSAIGQIAPWYDGEGNLTFDGRLVYVYDFKNRLSEVYELVAADPETEAAMQTFGGVNAPRETLERGRSEIRRRFGEDMSQALAADRSARTSSRLYGSVPSTRSMTSAQTAEFQVVLIAAYGYDPFNRRIVRVVPGEELDVRYSYDGWREVEELVPVSDGGTMVAQARKVMVWGAEFSEILSYHRWEDQGTGQWDWTSYMVSQDEQGSVTWLHRADGSEVEAVEYDPYGKRTVFPAAGGSQARSTVGFDVSYTGHRIDHETGLIYARNRYLHTGWGRFVTFDPLGPWADRGNLGNGYGYVGNMPTTGTDPSGLMSIVGGNGGGGGGAISSGGSSSGGGFEDGVCGGVGGSPGGERAGGAGGAGGNQGEGGGSTPRARTTRCCAPADRVIIIVLYSPTAGRDVFINNSAVEAQKRLKANVGGGIIVTVDEEGALATADYRIPEGVAGEVPAEVVYLPGHGTSVEVPFPEGKKSTGAMLDDNEIVSTKRVADMNRGAIEGFVQLAQRSGVIVHINSAHHITVESCFQGLGEGELVKIDTGGRAFGGQGLVTRHAVSRDASMATAAADMFDHPVFSYKGTIDSSSFDGILPNAFSEPVFVLPMR